MTGRYVMALDLGSTSARTVLVDPVGRIVSEARNPVTPLFPRPGWVELDPVALWTAQLDSIQRAHGPGRRAAPPTSPRSASPRTARP